jgi:hypothetical protein
MRQLKYPVSATLNAFTASYSIKMKPVFGRCMSSRPGILQAGFSRHRIKRALDNAPASFPCRTACTRSTSKLLIKSDLLSGPAGAKVDQSRRYDLGLLRLSLRRPSQARVARSSELIVNGSRSHAVKRRIPESSARASTNAVTECSLCDECYWATGCLASVRFRFGTSMPLRGVHPITQSRRCALKLRRRGGFLRGSRFRPARPSTHPSSQPYGSGRG